MGPDTYDLASLLRDRGVARILGEETEMELVDYYAEWRATASGTRRAAARRAASMRRRYFETLLQRSIKILGTFAKQPIDARTDALPRLHPADAGERPPLPRRAAGIRRARGLLPMDFSRRRRRASERKGLHHGQTQDHAAAR